MRKVKISGIVVLSLFALSIAMPGFAAEGKEGRELVLLFTHDLHSYFLPHRILTPGGEQLQQGGYAKLANLLNEQRILHKNETLRIDAGDFAMGTLFHASFSEEAAELRLMGKMGYDVATLGNHDFDFHSAGLAAALQAARTKSKLLPALVASNVVFSKEKKEDDPLEQAFREYPVRDYTVVERNGLRIGIFGIMGRDAADDTPFAAPVKFADPVETARRVVGILRNKEKVDIIICLSHSGTSSVSRKSEDEELAREAPQIDVIISGHTHTVLPKPLLIGKTIIASAGCYGEYLGILKINHAPGEGVKLGSYELKNVREDIPDNKVIAAEIARYKETVNRKSLAGDRLSFDQVVAQSYFNMESLAAAYAHPREMGLGNMITDAYRFAVKKAEGRDHEYVSMSIAPLGVIRDSFQKGKITVADVFQTLSLGVGTDGNPGYPLVAFYVSGGEVKDALEVETTVAPLLKEGAHLQVSGIKFSYNPHRMFFDRVTEVLVQNEKGQYKPLEKQKLYRVCANLYAAEMLNYVSRATYGLLKLEPKDKNGRVLPDLKQAIVYANKNSPQSKELKEWKALLRYMQSFPRDSGIPLVPAQYKTTEGRILAVPSWNPVKLIAGGNAITYGALAVLVILLGLAVFLVRYLARRFRAAPPPDPGAGN